jgi:hypothetical protein
MARPKPPEDFDTITVRLPASLAKKVRELAADSRTSTGQKMSVNQYCAGLLSQSALRGVKIVEQIRYDTIEDPEDVALVAELDDESPLGKRKRGHGT